MIILMNNFVIFAIVVIRSRFVSLFSLLKKNYINNKVNLFRLLSFSLFRVCFSDVSTVLTIILLLFFFYVTMST